MEGFGDAIGRSRKSEVLRHLRNSPFVYGIQGESNEVPVMWKYGLIHAGVEDLETSEDCIM